MSRKLLLAVLAGLVTAAVSHLQRGYTIELSGLFGAAIGALAFAALRTADELRRHFRR